MENQKIVTLKTALEPDYYQKFHCIGGACTNTCCQVWKISLSKQDYTKVRGARKPPELQKLVESCFKRTKGEGQTQYAKIVLDSDGNCPMLSAAGLCSLQLACGYAVLPEICKSFPRARTPAPPYLVRSCSPGCEEVVRLLLAEKNGLNFHKVPLEKSAWTAIAVPLGNPLAEQYESVQTICIGILQNRSYPLDQRMILLGMALRDWTDIQRREDWAAVPEWFRQKLMMTQGDGMAGAMAALPTNERTALLANLLFLKMQLGVAGGKPSADLARLSQRIYTALGVGDQSAEQSPQQEAAMLAAYATLKVNGEGLLQKYAYFFENLMVDCLVHLGIPVVNLADSNWDGFTWLCHFYNYVRLSALCLAGEEAVEDALIRNTTTCARQLLHGKILQNSDVQTMMDEIGCRTLAHMAAIVKG